MIKKILLGLTISTISFVSNAQTGGQHVFEFMNLTNSSRIAALGSNVMSINDNDITLILSNPSLLNENMNNQLALNYTDFFGGVNYGFVTYGHSFKDIGDFAASIQYLNYGTFTETSSTGEILGEFSASDVGFVIGWGRSLSPHFRIGANAKFLYSAYHTSHASGVATDIAGSYINDEKYFSASLLIRHAGAQLNEFTSGIHEPMPFEIQLAASKRMMHVPLRFSFVAHHLNKWDLRWDEEPEIDPLTGEIIEPSKISQFSDNLMRHIIVGAELSPSKNFSLRIGYNYQRRKENIISTKLSTVGISWGFGFRIKKFNLSYARSAYHLAGSPNVITITTDIDQLLRN